MALLIARQLPNDHLQGRKQVQHKLPMNHVEALPETLGRRIVQRKPTCACDGTCPRCIDETLQKARLEVGAPDDDFERDADRIAEEVLQSSNPSSTPSMGHTSTIQRKCGPCSSGGDMCPECAAEDKEEPLLELGDETQLQAKKNSTSKDNQSKSHGPDQKVPSIVNEVLQSPGKALDSTTRAFFEPRFGQDFSQVRIHSDATAAESAQSVNALAYTAGHDVVFGPGQYLQGGNQGNQLLAHELTHVLQQIGSSQEQLTLQRQVLTQGTTRPSSRARASDYRNIAIHFDGAELIVSGDGHEIFRYSAQSGRPIQITREDAAQCGANQITDTYMNDRRFVGIRDAGPIPEGTYSFSPPSIERFTFGEEIGLITAGVTGHQETTVHGRAIHAGDWGSGRVALQPAGRLREGPCGNANNRSGFYLHGGLLSGSSGCIDIGTHFDELADFLQGYTRTIRVTVGYERSPPSVGVLTGFSGAMAYGAFHLRQEPHLRLGLEFQQGTTRGVVSMGHDLVVQWAGGALSLGGRLDIPFSDKEAFIRAGLSGGVSFRLLRGLYGQLFGGYSWDLGRSTSGAEVGGGLSYDFGRVHLEALYNVLRPMATDQRVHQALVGVGFTF